MQIWAETGKSALPIRNYSQILYQFLTFTQNLKRSRKFIFFTFSLKFFKLSILVGGTYSFFEKNVYNFSISSWQASPSLLQLTQFRTESFSRAGISSVSVSCRPKLANNSEDIFFCSFFISFFSR